ncbi:uncharacterized protein CLUP02_07052 [Colletotrichum lupini]|uniref:Uncharacterized protein n=1 Tax=Colletotrichum lupini TaxID=145971 RepID=A0A9Q8SRL5_9PEZI|nr:uncharacterized protein CLUP02_07052 [Colletotrichum lupini]UQC81566.1 hypothetical protein CLUP02_07052 [Colletotrichum lupini]
MQSPQATRSRDSVEGIEASRRLEYGWNVPPLDVVASSRNALIDVDGQATFGLSGLAGPVVDLYYGSLHGIRPRGSTRIPNPAGEKSLDNSTRIPSSTLQCSFTDIFNSLSLHHRNPEPPKMKLLQAAIVHQHRPSVYSRIRAHLTHHELLLVSAIQQLCDSRWHMSTRLATSHYELHRAIGFELTDHSLIYNDFATHHRDKQVPAASRSSLPQPNSTAQTVTFRRGIGGSAEHLTTTQERGLSPQKSLHD